MRGRNSTTAVSTPASSPTHQRASTAPARPAITAVTTAVRVDTAPPARPADAKGLANSDRAVEIGAVDARAPLAPHDHQREAREQRGGRDRERDPDGALRGPFEGDGQAAARGGDQPAVGVAVDEGRGAVLAVDRRPPPRAVALAEDEPERLTRDRAVDADLHLGAAVVDDLHTGRVTAAGGRGRGDRRGEVAARAERHRVTARLRAEHEAVDVDPGVHTGGTPHDVVARGQRERGIAELEVDRAARGGDGGIAVEPDRHRRAVDGEQVVAAGGRGSAPGSAAARRTPAMPTSASATGITIGCCSWNSMVVTGRTPVTVTRTRVTGERRRTSPARSAVAFSLGLVVDRGQIDGARLAAGVDAHLGRHGVPAVGHDLQVEVVERRRLRRSAPRPTAPAAGRRRCSTRWPGHRRTPTSRAPRTSPGRCSDARTVMPPFAASGTPSAASSTSSGAAVANRIVPPALKARSAGTRNLRTSASSSWEYRGGIDDGARPAHLVDEGPVGGERPGGRDEVGRHPHHLVGVHVGGAGRVVADPDLGEADVVAQTGSRWCRRRWSSTIDTSSRWKVRVGNVTVCPASVRDASSRSTVDGIAAVERQLHLGEVPVRSARRAAGRG